MTETAMTEILKINPLLMTMTIFESSQNLYCSFKKIFQNYNFFLQITLNFFDLSQSY